MHQNHRATVFISIHAPLAGSDRYCHTRQLIVLRFQSTLPSRGATTGRDQREPAQHISIHAPLAGSDRNKMSNHVRILEFQSTLPSRGATAFSMRLGKDAG